MSRVRRTLWILDRIGTAIGSTHSSQTFEEQAAVARLWAAVARLWAAAPELYAALAALVDVVDRGLPPTEAEMNAARRALDQANPPES